MRKLIPQLTHLKKRSKIHSNPSVLFLSISFVKNKKKIKNCIEFDLPVWNHMNDDDKFQGKTSSDENSLKVICQI